MTPERIAQLRALLDDEMRDACQLTDALSDVLDEVERYAAARERALRPMEGATHAPCTPAERVARVRRGGPPITDAEREAAAELLVALLTGAELNGFTAADFAWVSSLADACVDVVLARSAREARR